MVDHSEDDPGGRSVPRPGSGTLVEEILTAFGSHGDRLAITLDLPGGPVEWTYRDLLTRVRRESRRLERAGVDRGTVVAIMTGDDPLTFVLRWAAHVLGAAVVLLADGYGPAPVRELVATVGARFLVTDAARGTLAREAVGDDDVGIVDVDAAPPPEDTSPVTVRARPEDLASISLTGGSTGVPKGVPRYAAVPPFLTPEALAPWRDVVQLLCTPVAHIGGTVAGAVLHAGGRLVLQRGFDPARALAAIARERVTLVFLLPRLLHRLLDDPALATTDVSSLQMVRIGSAPASPRRLGEALERLGPVVDQVYGSIEATNITMISAAELARPELRATVGRPGPGTELSIRDDAGAELALGEVGEIWVRGPSVMAGYLHAPEQTAAVLRDGWFRTGDLGRLDADGYLTLSGRSKDVIFAEGARIYPAEIEESLDAHPAVAASAVVAVAGADDEESAVAAVVASAGETPSPEDLAEWVARARGDAWRPGAVYLVDDLPVTPSGKLDRPALRRILGSASS